MENNDKYPKAWTSLLPPVSLTTAALCGIAAAALALYGNAIIALMLPPLAAVYSPDGNLDPLTVAAIHAFAATAIPALLLAAACFAAYGLLWAYFSKVLGDNEAAGQRNDTLPRNELYLLGFILVLAVIPRLHGMFRGLTYDETFTAYHFIDTGSLVKTLSTYIYFNNHIAYSLLAACSERFLGLSAFGLRFPALVLGLGGIIALYFFARSFFDGKTALTAAFLLAVSPIHVEWSASARGYSGVILFSLLSDLFLLKTLDKPDKRYASGFIISAALAHYFHLYSALNTFIQVIFVIYLGARTVLKKDSGANGLQKKAFHTAWVSFFAIFSLTLLCYLPVLPHMLFNIALSPAAGEQPWLFLRVIALFYSGSTAIPGFAIAFSLCLALTGFIRQQHRNSRTACLLGQLFLFPFILPLFIKSSIQTRFFAFLLPYFVLFIASGLAALWAYPKRPGLKGINFLIRTGCIAAISIYSITALYRGWNSLPEDRYADAAVVLKSAAAGGTTACAIGLGAELYPYYGAKNTSIPVDLNELRSLLLKSTKLTCAFYEQESYKKNTSEMRTFLIDNSVSTERYGAIAVYTVIPVTPRPKAVH